MTSLTSYLSPTSAHQARLYKLKQKAKGGKPAPTEYYAWLAKIFPTYFSAPLADHHHDFWRWVDEIPVNTSPPPFIAIWPRGGGKSTNTETAVAYIGAQEKRKYCLYVCQTQEQADDHVQNIAGLIESTKFGEHYPQMAEKHVGKHGNSKGWRRNRLRCANGFIVDAMGLDSARRGAKLEEYRPDLIIFDDIDAHEDTPATTEKKIAQLTKKILPAGAANVAVLGVQNLIHENSIFSQFADGRAEFLINRVVSGPFPAVVDLQVEYIDGKYTIVDGSATWVGQSLETCQAYIDRFGLTEFKNECQHDVEAPPGGLWDHIEWQYVDWKDLPDLVKVAVWCDPAVTDKDDSDSQAIVAGGVDEKDNIYKLYAFEQRTSPTELLKRAILKAIELKAQYVGIETDQGGDVWIPAYKKICDDLRADPEHKHILKQSRLPSMRQAKAGAGYGSKVHRNQEMLASYERGQVKHVKGAVIPLEKGLKRFPKTKPFDCADAAYWVWADLRGHVALPEKQPEQKSKFNQEAGAGSRWKRY